MRLERSFQSVFRRPTLSSWRLTNVVFSRRAVHEGTTPEAMEQRRKRPMSPHLTIYQPQITWVMSIGHRVSGTALATAIYGFGLFYATAAPTAITESLVTTVASAPASLVFAGKFILALPFFYHSLNGIRHLIWDLGYALSLRGCYITGWMVNAGSILGTALVTLL